MSAMTSGSGARTLSMPLRSPLTAPQKRPAGTRPLRLVPQRRSSAAKAPFVVVVVTLLVGGLLGLLLLNTLVAQDSFTLHDLSKHGRTLQQQEQDLARQVQALQAPAALAAHAGRLGMVPGGAPAFLRLSDGKVLGQPTAGAKPAAAKPAAAKPAAAKPAALKATTAKPTTAKPTVAKPTATQLATRSTKSTRSTTSTTSTKPTKPTKPTNTGVHR